MDGLVFQLAGPLASFGTLATGEHRRTEPVPTKSAILGLVGAAMGVEREDLDFFSRAGRSLGLATRSRGRAQLVTDFHTVQTLPEPQAKKLYPRTRRAVLKADGLYTTISQRDYLSDVYVIVALWQRSSDAPALSAILEALASPRFFVSLGRRSCVPMLPCFPHVVRAESPRGLLDESRFPNEELFDEFGLLLSPRVHDAWEDDEGAEASTQIRRDGIDSSRARNFVQRREYWLVEERP